MFLTKKRAFIFFVFSVLAGLTAVFLFSNYISEKEESFGEQVTIFLANEDIPSGSPILESMLTPTEIPKMFALDSYVYSYEDLADQISLVPIQAGELLTRTVLREMSNVPTEHRLVQLRSPMAIFDDEFDVLDRVDLVVSYEDQANSDEGRSETRVTETIFRDVEVIRVYKQEDEIISIGVALELDDAVDVIWVMNYGKEIRVLKSNNMLSATQEGN